MHAPPDHHAGARQRGRTPARWRAAAVTAAAALSLAVGTVPASAAGSYTVTATIPLPVRSYLDAVVVDPAAGTVYVANYADDTVSVIDAATRAVTATIPVGPQPGAVAVDSSTHTVYVTNSGGGTVSVISAARTPTTLTAHIGLRPHLTLTATLTASGRPLSGQPISFTTGHTHLCTRPTSIRGIATCVLTAAQARQAEHHHGAIQATYPGNTSYQPSSATATP